MTGDYTKVALRPDDVWTGARMQAGRTLLDSDWNLNLDAAARLSRAVASDAIGPAGVVAGSDAFAVSMAASELKVNAGRMWVDGLLAHLPRDLAYGEQDQIAALPASGRALVFVDAFEQHVQPAEAPDELVDPALAPVDTAGRTRVAVRIRATSTAAATCREAWEAFAGAPASTGTLSIERVGAAVPADPCAPPGSPFGGLPNGLLRIEVIDPGDAAGARFAWSWDNGASAVAVAEIAGDRVTLRPSAAVAFAAGDKVEIGWLARRADRVAHGALYTVAQPPEPGPGGDVLVLDRAVTAPATAAGLVARRWDGDSVGAAAAVAATLHGDDLGVRFLAGAGGFEAGDAWGARVREEAGAGVEQRVDAPPDWARHAFAPLALVDLDTRTVLADCRPAFIPLTQIEHDCGACTVTARPGDDLQAKLDLLPAGGGMLCLGAGLYELAAPVTLAGRSRVVITGAGPASVVRASDSEAALVVDGCAGVEIRALRIEGGSPGGAGDPRRNGALTVIGSTDVTIADCGFACPESPAGGAQTCVTVRSGGGRDPDAIRIERNRIAVGAWETGILVLDAGRATIAGNTVVLAAPGAVKGGGDALARTLQNVVEAALEPEPARGTKAVKVPGGQVLQVVAGSEGEPLVTALAQHLTERQVARSGARKALLAAARRAAAGAGRRRLPQAAQALLGALEQELRVVGQGIVAGGTRVGTVEILDNIVEDAVQGIHVGVSSGRVPGREAAETVMIARNVVHALVPPRHDRDRHAVFVGNAQSIHVLDTVATLRRTGRASVPPTPVEAIRIHGELGAFMAVRQSSLRGFDVGVRVAPLATPPARLWLVAETMAVGATAALDAPPSVDRERNVR